MFGLMSLDDDDERLFFCQKSGVKSTSVSQSVVELIVFVLQNPHFILVPDSFSSLPPTTATLFFNIKEMLFSSYTSKIIERRIILIFNNLVYFICFFLCFCS